MATVYPKAFDEVEKDINSNMSNVQGDQKSIKYIQPMPIYKPAPPANVTVVDQQEKQRFIEEKLKNIKAKENYARSVANAAQKNVAAQNAVVQQEKNKAKQDLDSKMAIDNNKTTNKIMEKVFTAPDQDISGENYDDAEIKGRPTAVEGIEGIPVDMDMEPMEPTPVERKILVPEDDQEKTIEQPKKQTSIMDQLKPLEAAYRAEVDSGRKRKLAILMTSAIAQLVSGVFGAEYKDDPEFRDQLFKIIDQPAEASLQKTKSLPEIIKAQAYLDKTNKDAWGDDQSSDIAKTYRSEAMLQGIPIKGSETPNQLKDLLKMTVESNRAKEVIDSRVEVESIKRELETKKLEYTALKDAAKDERERAKYDAYLKRLDQLQNNFNATQQRLNKGLKMREDRANVSDTFKLNDDISKDKQVIAAQTNADNIKRAAETLQQDNARADNITQFLVARMGHGAGVMSEQDLVHAGYNQALLNRINQWFSLNISGKMTPENRVDAAEILIGFAKNDIDSLSSPKQNFMTNPAYNTVDESKRKEIVKANIGSRADVINKSVEDLIKSKTITPILKTPLGTRIKSAYNRFKMSYNSTFKEGGATPSKKQKTIKRTGTDKISGKKVIEYTDGTREYK